jgi:hypothetical protein
MWSWSRGDAPFEGAKYLTNNYSQIYMGGIEVYKVRATFRDFKRRGYFAQDTANGDCVVTSDAAVMAFQLHGKGDRVNYDGTMTEFHTYLDGYFGRPLIPADAYLLRRLNKREKGELEREIAKAEAELKLKG